ncbi:MAG TPA: C25 family cysteine peptidase [Phnomibacter sp.]|nr:C25 family cysteine peptidase [Phnomibacter sp.]
MKLRKYILSIITVLAITDHGLAQLNNEWIDHNKTYYKFLVARDGVHRIQRSTLESWGLANVPAEDLQLWRNGGQVPLFTYASSGPLPADGYIEFIGKKNEGRPDRSLYLLPAYQLSDHLSLFTDTAAYFLTVNPGGNNLRFALLDNDLTGNLPTPTPFLLHTVRHDYKRANDNYFVNKGFAVNYGEYVYSSSYDIGEMLSSEEILPGQATRNRQAIFANMLPAANTGLNARIRTSWAGTSPESRIVTAHINATQVMSRNIPTFQAFRDSNISVSPSIFNGSSDTVYMANTSANPLNRFVVGFVEIEYPRQTNAANASYFESSLPANNGNTLLQIAAFNHGNTPPVLYNLTTGYRMVGNIDANGNIRFLLPPSTQRQYFVVTTYQGNFFTPVTTGTQKTFTNFSLAANMGDYLIITNKLLLGDNAVENYRAYRSSAAGGGFNARIYDIEELVDQFAFGIKMHPLSIKNFLRFARQNFSIAPKFCFLIGKGVTYDEFRVNESNVNARRLNLVPTFGYPGSDNLLASNDLTAYPATPIGRLSVINTAEVTTYLEKVKEYEAEQANPSNLQEDRAWMKNVVHVVGANDAGTEQQIRPYMNEYTNIIRDTLFGASVTTFNKFNTTTVGTIENVLLSQLFEKGISLLTYFGHSSATALDYNLDDPNAYNNPGKYPMFLLNGCNAGNFFTFEVPRLQTPSTISERYVLAQNRGAIGLVASTHFGLVSGLGVYSRGFYRSVGQSAYNQSIGRHIQNSVQFMYNTLGTEYQARFHAEQQTLHGDPAVKLNSFDKPDYSIESSNIIIEPSFVSIAETKFDNRIYYYNLGKAVNDSIVIEVKRQFPVSSIYPNGFTETVYRQKRKAALFIDSIDVSMPIVSERDKGINLVTITLDADGQVDELSELNNTITRQVVIFENELRPVYPANFAIVNQPNIRLIASTANPLSEPLSYIMEMDTTEFFNSNLKISRVITSGGGIVEIDPGINLVDGRVYYWRLGLQGAGGAAPLRWNTASFVYLAGPEIGFNQSHFYQHTKSVGDRIRKDTASRLWKFEPSLNNLFINHSIFPTSGTEDNHFSISVNNNLISTSACVGHSMIFNVFDPLTMRPLLLPGDDWGNGLCANNRNPYNYEWDDRTIDNRRKMMEFMDSIPNGAYVVVRKILDQPYANETYADRLKADEQILGAGNSLYQKLKDAGFEALDSFNRPRTYTFIYKKNDPLRFVEYKLSDGLFDRIQININLPTIDTMGIVTSPVFGPASAWKNAEWASTSTDNGDGDRVRIRVKGITATGAETTLFDVPESQQSIDLAGVSAVQYPNLKLEMLSVDSIKGTPLNLDHWRLYYTPVPEGALAANILFEGKDTLTQGETYNFRIAFKNISTRLFDSLKVRMTVTDKNNVTTEFVQRRRPLPPGDTIIVNYSLDTWNYPGLNTLYVAVNPDKE